MDCLLPTWHSLQAIDELLDEVLGDGNPRNDAAAEGSLGAFENQVSAQSGKKIAVEDADRLSEFVRQIIELLTGN